MLAMLPLFLLFRVNNADHLCNYIINRSQSTLEICASNSCEKYLDPLSVIVKPNDCKTNVVHLAFSSYRSYQTFLDGIPWKLSDLFTRKSPQIRRLRIYLDEIHSDDHPTDFQQLNQLGNQIDLYQIYIRNLPANHSLQRFIHYDPEWSILQVQFICNSIIKYHEQACATQILPPSPFAPRRTKILPLTTEQSRKKTSLFPIVIPILILLITIILAILVYRKIRTDSPVIGADVQPYHISCLPSPHEESLYKGIQRHL